HVAAIQDFGSTGAEDAWIYVDGSGREVQRKRRVEPGPQDPDDPNGSILDPRFVGTGRTIYDNKGNPVKKYEPYFAAGSRFDTELALVQQGVTPVLRYDPLGRLIRTDQPNATFSEVVFDAWSKETRDEIDSLDATSTWYVARSGGSFPREAGLEKDAATK